MRSKGMFHKWAVQGVGILALAGQPALAQPGATEFEEAFGGEQGEPVEANGPAPSDEAAEPVEEAHQSGADAFSMPVVQPIEGEIVQPIPVLEPVMPWNLADAAVLLSVIEAIGDEGLLPADYQPDALREAMAAGEGEMLDEAASHSFAWLVEDLRDGRTPMTERVQWFAVDPDQDEMPTERLMTEALEQHDVAGVLASLAPTHPDYAKLKTELALIPVEDEERRALIRANMDRWRWLKRDLGEVYIMNNVPEFQVRFVRNNRIIRAYRTVVGKPGRTATPQLAEKIEAVVFNPTWTVPQSIVRGEGLGAQLLANPARARTQNFKVTKGPNGYVSVVQQPGPGNALGIVKIDMPNPHAIYFHDTPSKALFNREVRAFSHGCVRVDQAIVLGMTIAIFGNAETREDIAAIQREVAEISNSGVYTRYPIQKDVGAYITYFTMGTDIDGKLRSFKDIYGRDKPVLASFAAPRRPKTTQRQSYEEIIELDNPL